MTAQAQNTTPEEVKKTLTEAITSLDKELRDINNKIHSNPELGYVEYKAHDNITALLESQNIKVTRHAYGLETSFEAEYANPNSTPDNSRLVVFNVEYDALPGIGHACGHNLIATASLASLFAVVELLKANPSVPGRVRALGTPAEEGGGGKIKLVDAGAFKGVDACMMVHPMAGVMYNAPKEFKGIPFGTSVASSKFRAVFSGRTAHAAAAPQDGINALDAAVLAYNGISMLRQQICSWERIHGIIMEGGEKANVIPSRAKLDYNVRSRTIGETRHLQKRVEACFEGAAIATGCKVEFEQTNQYAEVVPSRSLCAVYAEFMENDLSLPQLPFDREASGTSIPQPGSYSTDQGNVTHVCPGFHPVYSIPADGGASNHTHEFTAAAITEEAYQATLATSKGMAWAGWKVLTDEGFAQEMKAEFEKSMAGKEV